MRNLPATTSPATTARGSAAPPPAGRHALPLAAIALVLAVSFAPVLAGGQFVYRDTGRLHAPDKRLVADELARGRLPEWNPYAGLGAPMAAGAVDAAQHPFNVLFLLLPFDAAFDGWVLLSYVLAAVGGYAWARSLGRGAAAAVAAGLAFALSGVLVSASDNVQYLTSYAALPLVLAAAQAYGSRGGAARLGLVGLASGLCAAGGDPQSWGLVALAVPLQAALLGAPQPRSTTVGRAAAAVAAVAVGAAPFLVPVVLWLPHSSRATALGAAELLRWNLHPLRLPEVLVPGLFRADAADPLAGPYAAYCGGDDPIPWFRSVYLGAATVALAVAGAVRSRRARWLVAAAVVLGWAALGPHAGFGWIAERLPVVRSFRYAEKLFVWPALLLAGAASFGLDAFRDSGAVTRRRLALCCAVAGAALLGAASLAYALPGPLLRAVARPGLAGAAGPLVENARSGALEAGAVLLLLAVVCAAAAAGRLSALRGAAAVAGIVALDLLAAAAPAYVLGRRETRSPPLAAAARATGVVTPFVLREERWPELGRSASMTRWGWRTLAPSWNVAERVRNLAPYTGMVEQRLRRITLELDDAHQVAAGGLWGFSAVVVPGRPQNAARAGVASPPEVLAEDAELPAFLVAAPHRERAYLEARAREVGEAEAYAFAASGGADGGSVVEGTVPAGLGAIDGAARVVIDDPGRTAVETRAGGPALLVLNDAFAPGWSARLDGREVAIVRANYLARGVWVPAGEHRVTFSYRTPGLRLGWALALAGATALAVAAFRDRRRPAA